MTPDDTDPIRAPRTQPAGRPHAPPGAPAAAPPAASRYTVVRPLASGGLGDVSVARDAELPRLVALKRLQARHRHRADLRDGFRREAEVTGHLEHPGVVPIYGLVTAADGEAEYAMRLVTGESLREACDRFHARPVTTPRYGLVVFRQLLARFVTVCQAVHFAHSRGYIHRDLKPDNVMLGDFGETYVVDWGLAKRFGDTDDTAESAGLPPPDGGGWRTSTGDIKGTLAYMPPEQAAGEVRSLGPAADVFALGAILFHMLTGDAPEAGGSAIDHVRALGEGRIPVAREALPAVPAGLDAVCSRAMAARPGDRYASAAEVAAEVERWLAGEPVSALPEGPGRRLVRSARRHPAAVGAAAVALALGSAALAGWLALNAGRSAELAASRLREAEARRAADAASARAAERFNLARRAVDDYLGAVAENPALAGDDLRPLRRALLESAAPFYRRLAERPDAAPEERADQAAAHRRLGDLHREAGNLRSAEREYGRAAEVAIEANAPEEVAAATAGLASVLAERGDLAGAVRERRRSLESRRLLAERDADGPARLERAAAHRELAAALREAGDPASALQSLDEALALAPGDPASLRERGLSLLASGDAAAAESPLRAALKSASDPATRHALGQSLTRQGKLDAAETELAAALGAREALAEAHPATPGVHADLAATYHAVGELLERRRDREAALQAFADASRLRANLSRQHPESAPYARDLGLSRLAAARLSSDSAALDEALTALRTADRLAPGSPTTREALRAALELRARRR